MGKAGKERKKRKLEAVLQLAGPNDFEEEGEEEDSDSEAVGEEDILVAVTCLESFYWDHRDAYFSKTNKALRTLLFPLIEAQIKARAHHEILEPARKDGGLDVATLRRVASFFLSEVGRPVFLAAGAGRKFRAALHPMVLAQQMGDPAAAAAYAAASTAADGDDRSFTGRISNALRSRNWALALTLLYDMSRSGDVLKLGSLQRWVRDCDVAADEGDRNVSLLLLDAVMRVGEMCIPPCGQQEGNERNRRPDLFLRPPSLEQIAEIHRFPPFSALPQSEEEGGEDEIAAATAPAQAPAPPEFRVVHSVPGPDRKPPSKFASNVFATAPGTIPFSSSSSSSLSSRRRRVDVPGVPGAFLMTDVLSARECERIIEVAEGIGYKPDAVDDIDNIVWLADESFWQPIFNRCEPMLPKSLGGCSLRGINARFRLFRYYPGAVYRPHIDGAWPGSGIDEEGKYTDDVFANTNGDRRYSKLTFLVYLNDVGGSGGGGGGGATTFFLPSREKGFPHIEARCVAPTRGHVLCFPHGDAQGSLVHEGSEVSAGAVKYIIRTDVLYSLD